MERRYGAERRSERDRTPHQVDDPRKGNDPAVEEENRRAAGQCCSAGSSEQVFPGLQAHEIYSVDKHALAGRENMLDCRRDRVWVAFLFAH
jgi:hypothetical protein